MSYATMHLYEIRSNDVKRWWERGVGWVVVEGGVRACGPGIPALARRKSSNGICFLHQMKLYEVV